MQIKHLPLYLLLGLALSACATPVKERIRLPGELPGWILAHKTQNVLNKSVTWEHIQEGEYISKWTRLYTVQFFDTKQRDLSAFMTRLLLKRAKLCKGIEWRVLQKRADAILYEWHSNGCKRYNQQHELVILMQGINGIHRAAYAQKVRQIPEETYQYWKKKLLGARLDPGSE